MSTAVAETPRVSRSEAYIFGFVSLFLVSFVAAASYFAYDCVGPLAPILKDPVKGLGLTTDQIGLLYSVYSIPVILFVVLGGVLADRLGVRKAGLLFTVVFALGTVLTAVGDYWVMIAGRLLFGIGAEAFYVVMNKVIAKWFKNRLLAMAFGLNLFLCRMGTILAFYGLAWMANNLGGWKTTLWIIAAISGVSIGATLLYAVLDRVGEKRGLTAVEEQEEEFKLKQVFSLPIDFWVISALCMVYYSAVFPFTAHATDFFTETHLAGMPKEEATEAAGGLVSIVTLMSALTTWLFGLAVDRFGKRATMMIVGSIVLMPCHLLLAFTDLSPEIPLVMMGLSFSLVPAALWPALPLMVKENQLGTAFGVIAMVQNVGLFAFPYLAGLLRESTGNWNVTMVMFSSLGLVAIALSFWLKAIEKRGGSYLDKA